MKCTLGIRVFFVVSTALSLVAGDWPQWRGPQRNGISGETGLLKEWPKEGPKLRWQKNLRTDFGGKHGEWAYSESPLIDGDALVCTPGGSEATMVALNKKTGGVIWKCAVPEGDEAAYASAVLVEVGGIRQYVQLL